MPNDDLRDEREIIATTIRYAYALDERRFEDLRDVFIPEATADLRGPQLEGVDAIIERIRGAIERFEVTQHLTATHQVHLDGDRATCRCYLQSQHVRHDDAGTHHLLIAGRYEDEFVRTDVGWRIAHRRLHVMWTAPSSYPPKA